MRIFMIMAIRMMKREKGRLAAAYFGIICSVVLIMTFLILVFSTQRYLINEEIREYGNWHIMVRDTEPEALRDTESFVFAGSYQKLGECTAAREYGTAAEKEGQAASAPAGDWRAVIAGYDSGLMERAPVTILSGRMPREGTSEAAAPLVRGMDGEPLWRIGDTVTADDGAPYTITGICSPAGWDYYADAEREAAYTLITWKKDGAECLYDAFYLTDEWKRIRENAREQFPGQETVLNSHVLYWYGFEWTDRPQKVVLCLMAILFGMILLGFFTLIRNAFSIAVEERTKQLGMLISLGATKRQIGAMVFFEILLLGLAAIPVGMGVSVGGIRLFFWLLSDRIAVAPVFPVKAALAGIFICLAVMGISAGAPARRAAGIEPLEAIRQQREYRAGRQTGRGAGLFYRLFGLEGMLAWKGFQRNKRKYLATAVSIFISVVLFIPSVYFTGKSIAEAEKNQPQGYEISVSGEGTSGDFAGELAAFEQMRQVQGVERGLFSVQIPAYMVINTSELSDDFLSNMKAVGWTEEAETNIEMNIIFIDEYSWKEYTGELGYEETVTDASEGILMDRYVNRGTYRPKEPVVSFSARLMKGPWVSLERVMVFEETEEGFSGIERQLDGWSVSRITDQYPMGIPAVSAEPCLIYPLRAWESVLGDAGEKVYSRCTGYFASKKHEDAFIRIRQIAEERGLDAVVRDERKDFEDWWNQAIIIRIFFYGFTALIGLIAGINIFSTVSFSLSSRKRELSVFVSVGMTDRGLLRMLRYECMLYCSCALVPGILAAFAACLLIYQVYARNWGEAFAVPWRPTAVVVLIIAAVNFLTVRYGARKLMRMDVMGQLKE